VTRFARLTLAGVLLAAAVPARAGEVKVSFSNGLVTIVALDASPREILGEWARLGQARITNLDRLAGGPVTLQLTSVPEAQALETLLRGTAGYVAAPRAELVAATSRYDRILLLPGVAPTVSATTTKPPATTNAGFGRGRPLPQQSFDPAADDEPDPSMPAPGVGLPGMGRDPARPGPNRQSMPGQVTMPGTIIQTPGGYPGMPTTQSSGAAQQVPARQPGYDYVNGDQRQTSPNSSNVPGVFTAPPPLPTTPDSGAGSPGFPAVVNTSSTVPGRAVTQPGQTVATPASATRPGVMTAAPQPKSYQNPSGLLEPVQPPVVNPNANPYGLPGTVKPATPTTPTGPIKKSGGDRGQN
jgi:hypothetical protein